MNEESSKHIRREIRIGAMNLLARREHSRRELQEKLGKRFNEIPLIISELNKLEAEGLLSDQRFTQTYIHARANKLYGPERIKQELHQSGINNEMIEDHLQTSDIDWQAHLQKLEKKKFGNFPAGDIKERAKRQRFFQYRGFNSDMIRNMKNLNTDD